jgi:hypothetical protein
MGSLVTPEISEVDSEESMSAGGEAMLRVLPEQPPEKKIEESDYVSKHLDVPIVLYLSMKKRSKPLRAKEAGGFDGNGPRILPTGEYLTKSSKRKTDDS